MVEDLKIVFLEKRIFEKLIDVKKMKFKKMIMEIVNSKGFLIVMFVIFSLIILVVIVVIIVLLV